MKYFSDDVSGNVHAAVRYINTYIMKKHPSAEIITIISVSAFSSIVVWRENEDFVKENDG